MPPISNHRLFTQPTLRQRIASSLKRHSASRALGLALATVLAPAAVISTVVATPAAAQQYAPMQSAQNLQISADRGLVLGSVLRFQVQAEPNALVNLTLQARRPINVRLNEVSSGVYVGEYAVRGNDRIRANDRVRVDVRQGRRALATNFTVPYQLDVYQPQPTPMADRVQHFTVRPADAWMPGTEVQFNVHAAAQSNVSVSVPGWSRAIALVETSPGRYEGSYTVRRQDRLPVNLSDIVATVQKNGRTIATSSFNPSEHPRPMVDNRAPEINVISPREGERVVAGTFDVMAELDDGRRGSGIDPRSVRLMVGSADVTAQTRIDGRRIAYRGSFNPGRYPVDLTARDMAGNAVRKNWAFDVVPVGTAVTPAPLQPVQPVALPHAIRVMSHAPNAAIAGPTNIAGQTTPFASVNVQVVGQVPVVGGALAVERTIMNQTVQADARGQFNVTFTPTVPMPGNRYNVRMTSNANGQVAESQMTLVHQ